MSGQITYRLAAAGGMAEMNGVFQIEMRGQRRQIVGQPCKTSTTTSAARLPISVLSDPYKLIDRVDLRETISASRNCLVSDLAQTHSCIYKDCNRDVRDNRYEADVDRDRIVPEGQSMEWFPIIHPG